MRDCFHFKDRGPLDMRCNLVYKITCSCGKKYIGHTKRNVYLRMEEHSKTSGQNVTAVGRHISEHPDHTVNIDDPDILGYSRYKFKREIKEALFIQDQAPELNIQAETRRLLLFSV